MPFDSLDAFVSELQHRGELVEISAEVDPYLEISEITNRVVKAGGPALLFTNVRGSDVRVLTNQFGSERRMAMAFDAQSLDEVASRLRRLLDLSVPESLGSRIAKLASFAPLMNAVPKTVNGGSCQDVVIENPDLKQLPVLTTWPLDAGPFITLGLVITSDPQTHVQNVGVYRMQIFDSKTAGMHWQRHKHGRAQAKKWGERVPVAVAIGTDPAVTYAATAPLPPIVDELAFAGLLRGKPVKVTHAKTVDLKVPADAEFILEGYVDNTDLRTEGPFGDHTGVYSLADLYPTFHCTAITHRRKPIWAATVVGKPPMEDAWLGKATERIFLPLLQMVVPEIVDYNLPVEGGFHNLCIVSIRKSYPGPRIQSDECALGARPHDDVDAHAARRRRRHRRARHPASRMVRAEQRRSEARFDRHAGSRSTISIIAARIWLRSATRSESTRRAKAPTKATSVNGRPTW